MYQTIRIAPITQAIRHLHDRYKFESLHAVNRWAVMSLIRTMYLYDTAHAGDIDEDKLAIESMVRHMPSGYILPEDPKARDYQDFLSDVEKAMESIDPAMLVLLELAEADDDAIDKEEYWLSYMQVSPDTFAISIRYGDPAEGPIVTLEAQERAPSFDKENDIYIADGKIQSGE